MSYKSSYERELEEKIEVLAAENSIIKAELLAHYETEQANS